MRKTHVVRHIFTQQLLVDYEVGSILEGPVKFPGLATQGGALFSVNLYNLENLTPTMNLHFFGTPLDGGAFADVSLFQLDPTTSLGVIATIRLANWFDVGAGKVAIEKNINLALPGNKARDCFMIAEFRTKHKPSVADALRLVLGVRR